MFLTDATTLLPDCTLSLSCHTLAYGLVLARLHWIGRASTTTESDNHGLASTTTESANHGLASTITESAPTTNTHNEPAFLTKYREEVNTYCWPCQKKGCVSNPWLLSSAAHSSSPAYGTAHSPSSAYGNAHASSPAYVLSTSGTTGDPVIVRALHCSIVPNIVDLRERFSCGEYDVVFNAAPLTFDPSVVEIFVSLSSGSSLLTVPEGVKSIPSRLAKALRPVTVLQATPTLIRRFGKEELRRGLLGPDSKLRVLAFGGESCPDYNTLATWKDCKNVTTFFNLFGLTEVSSWATCYQLPDAPGLVLLGNLLPDCPQQVDTAHNSNSS